jgi:uncharacterized protein YprB with RNaseH-like and TPR domain
MAKDIVYFDLETQRSFTAVGGSKNKAKMGVSVGVAYSTRTGQYHIFDEGNVHELGDMLLRADLVVGFNHMEFDYPVLQGYVLNDMVNQTINLDMLLDLEKRIGHRVKLDSLASSSLGSGKSADGLDALKWWQEYKKTGDITPMMKIAEYCCFDVKVTKCVHEFGIEHGFVKYEDKAGNISQVEVNW